MVELRMVVTVEDAPPGWYTIVQLTAITELQLNTVDVLDGKSRKYQTDRVVWMPNAILVDYQPVARL
ncbi:MAG: hypothetical protein ACE5EH_08265 [Gammaproteobacteria bacterium]